MKHMTRDVFKVKKLNIKSRCAYKKLITKNVTQGINNILYLFIC